LTPGLATHLLPHEPDGRNPDGGHRQEYQSHKAQDHLSGQAAEVQFIRSLVGQPCLDPGEIGRDSSLVRIQANVDGEKDASCEL
jgi:hypothetical protein